MRFGLIAVAVVGMLIASVGCPRTRNTFKCGRACAALENCGFLPSALGAQSLDEVDRRDNCQERCESSDNEIVEEIWKCSDKAKVSAPGMVCGSECETLSTCLRGAFPKDTITGQAALRVLPVRSHVPGMVEATVTQCDGSVACKPGAPCPSARGGEYDEASAARWCKEVQAGSMRVFVRQNDVYTWSSALTCGQLLTTGVTFEGLLPGHARLGIEIRGEPPKSEATDAGKPEVACKIVYGTEVGLVAAGEVKVAFVPLPEQLDEHVYDCENCTDAVDNDGNGSNNCGDPNCASVCAVDAGPSATDAAPSDAALDGD